jgi:hypothetical protein
MQASRWAAKAEDAHSPSSTPAPSTAPAPEVAPEVNTEANTEAQAQAQPEPLHVEAAPFIPAVCTLPSLQTITIHNLFISILAKTAPLTSPAICRNAF